MKKTEKGSLALEQVLFIAAIVGLGVFITGFYNKLGAYFSNVPIPVATQPTTQN